MNKVIILGGPTGIGKTKLGVELAKEIGGEIISADSMQIYKGMDIGTAKVTEEEMDGVPHHLINIVYPNEIYTVANYRIDAKEKIRNILKRGKYPIILGGTGLYIHSLLYILHQFGVPPHFEFRQEMEKLAKEKGVQSLYQTLKEKNPKRASKVDPKNLVRIIRALEIEKFSDGKRKMEKEKDSEFDNRLFALTMNRSYLYDRINKRVDEMLTSGLIDEVNDLLKQGYSKDLTSMKAIGYKEVISYLEGDWDYEMMVTKLKQYTRNYAKRQLTWFRRYPELTWLDKDKLSNQEIISLILEEIKDES
ncbi:MAG: tRNA (adenosine(37)-N6)-dimethylallyltransferase MiaA [Tissierellia bacterium]|nr:tRNA (adenosine(37)-N6)-dimethylallyltransferase MiaA [Tissierellia bacterium]